MTGTLQNSDALLTAVQAGTRVIDLAQPLHSKVPHSPNQPGFQYALIRRHGDMIRSDGGSAANDLLVTGAHTGTHVDALAHVSHAGLLYGGISAASAQSSTGFSSHGIDTLEPIVTRGVLLDVAGSAGVSRLAPGRAVTADDLAQASSRAGVEIRSGDAVLIRTGWAQLWNDPAGFTSAGLGVPGPTEEAARWLADAGIRISGSDTTAYEHISAEHGHSLLPVHRLMLVERGIPIVEMLNLEELAADGIHEFTFVLAPLRIVGATGSPVRPLAVIGR